MESPKLIKPTLREKLSIANQWVKSKIHVPDWLRGKKGTQEQEPERRPLVIGLPTNFQHNEITFEGDLGEFESVIRQAQEDRARMQREREAAAAAAEEAARTAEWKRKAEDEGMMADDENHDDEEDVETGSTSMLLPPIRSSGAWGDSVLRSI